MYVCMEQPLIYKQIHICEGQMFVISQSCVLFIFLHTKFEGPIICSNNSEYMYNNSFYV